MKSALEELSERILFKFNGWNIVTSGSMCYLFVMCEHLEELLLIYYVRNVETDKFNLLLLKELEKICILYISR